MFSQKLNLFSCCNPKTLRAQKQGQKASQSITDNIKTTNLNIKNSDYPTNYNYARRVIDWQEGIYDPNEIVWSLK